MAVLLGIDIGHRDIRVARVRTGYRKLVIEAMREVPVAEYPSVDEAVRAAAAPLWTKGEAVAVNFPGDRTFVRRLEVPRTAQRQLAEVLPFELEAQLPFDLAEAVFDTRVLQRSAPAAPLTVLAFIARVEDARQRVNMTRETIGQEPERLEPGGLALANLYPLVPALSAQGPIMVVHLDAELTDVIVLRNGQIEFARTITGGTANLPESAGPLARDLRQTVYAWRAEGGAQPTAVYLTGPGSAISGAEAYLSAEVGVPVAPLPEIKAEGVTAEKQIEALRCARAIGLALGLQPRPRSLNLRQGPLAFERGYDFLREKIPMLTALAALILASFLFATWMEVRALNKQNAVLQDALASVTTDVLGEEIRDPTQAMDQLTKGASSMDDPMPHMDGFDLMVQISKAVPADVTHDIEELDFQKEHAIIHGIVPSIPDAQQIAATLQNVPCFKNVKIVRTNQVVNENRQKYVLEFDVKCPTDEKKSDKPGAKASAQADGAEAEAKR